MGDDGELEAERAARRTLFGDDALDQHASAAVPRAEALPGFAVGVEDDELSRLEGPVAAELLAEGELLFGVARREDFDAELGDAELPGLPRVDEVVLDTELHEGVGSEAAAWILAVVIDEVVLADRVGVAAAARRRRKSISQRRP